MAFWSKWFSSPAVEDKAASSLDYKGFLIEATPYRDGREYQLAGVISKDGKSHKFIRADKFSDKATAAEIAISKGKLIVDQLGEGMFKS